MLSAPITIECLKPVPWWYAEVVQPLCRVELHELS
jgi:hypothetical protein